MKPNREKNVPTHFHLSPSLLARLADARDKTGVPMVEFVRRAIDAALLKVGL